MPGLTRSLHAAEHLMLFALVIAIKGAGNRFELVGDCIFTSRCSLLQHPSSLQLPVAATAFQIVDCCTRLTENRFR
jgi:hypothetical protein